MKSNGKVSCRVTKMVIPTYPEPAKVKLPIYCENRCHQRTSGRVYPNAVVKEVVRDHKIDQEHKAIVLENDYIELIILPDIGGRIFGARDKTNNYDFFYRQHVIKPALIGLLGSWLSGGAEFNWPMHHRPSTYLPTDYSIQEDEDGTVTVWLSEHEPMDRMKGMVGIKLSPDKAMFETVARVFNRTELPQTFLWWENIAVPVNSEYQIFFPQDVNHVHFHRKRAVTEYPVASKGMYNGKDYREGERDIRWHKNTPEATSYFSAKSNYDFFGGYDHGKDAGVVHVANRHVSPGKKMFTWAYNQLASCWENALTDSDGAYAELMAGVYSDNQPDFSWLEVGEVKQFSQFWYPIKELGEPLNANLRAAFNFSTETGLINIYAVEDMKDVTLEVSAEDTIVYTKKLDLAISQVSKIEADILKKYSEDSLRVRFIDACGKEIISFCRKALKLPVVPERRPENPSPYELDNPDELYLAGLHMKQYRDALTKPDVYWKRAVELNPEHYRAFTGLGLSALKEFNLEEAKRCFRRSIDIQTKYNPNPRDSEAYYCLGITMKYQGEFDDAYDAFYKSIWNLRWRSPGYYALATIDCIRGDFETARTHLLESLDAYAGNQKARNLLAVVESKLGNSAREILSGTLLLDPVDYWTLNESGKDFFDMMASDSSQTILDIVFEYLGAGLYKDAEDLLTRFLSKVDDISPMVLYTFGWVLEKNGEDGSATYDKARNICPDYCFPSRIEEMQILQHVVDHYADARAAYYLGNLLYGKEHYLSAIEQWEYALDNGETYYVLYRNLGMAYYNNQRDNIKALHFMKQAYELNTKDSQLTFDYNYLLQITDSPIEQRLSLLERDRVFVDKRDDLFLELVRAYNDHEDYEKALQLLAHHTFTPCEGGEHEIVDQYIFANLQLGKNALLNGEYEKALKYFQDGQVFKENLGAGVWNIAKLVPCMYYEAKSFEHIDRDKGQAIYKKLADMGTDFFSYMYEPALDCYRAMAFKELGDKKIAEEMLKKCIKKWKKEIHQKDYGYFKLTPFFISLFPPQDEIRKAHYNKLLKLAWHFRDSIDLTTSD